MLPTTEQASPEIGGDLLHIARVTYEEEPSSSAGYFPSRPHLCEQVREAITRQGSRRSKSDNKKGVRLESPAKVATGATFDRRVLSRKSNKKAAPFSSVFLSYASEDREFASLLARAFKDEGISTWWDRTIPPGKSFDEVIEAALVESKCVMVLWTESSAKSEWVNNEAREGMRRRILIPIVSGNVTIPFEFRHIHAADLTGWPAPDHSGFKSLVESVEGVLRRPSTEDHPA